ncbi:MAG: hypothetical protein IPJ34_34380 [Myxococcales bacterium]|nr:hypothetical protein [Myxococcales bacterium]
MRVWNVAGYHLGVRRLEQLVPKEQVAGLGFRRLEVEYTLLEQDEAWGDL